MILATLLRAGFERAPGGYRRRPGASPLAPASRYAALAPLLCSTLRAAGVETDRRGRWFALPGRWHRPGVPVECLVGPTVPGARVALAIDKTPQPFSRAALWHAERGAAVAAAGWTLLHVDAAALRDPATRALAAAEVAFAVRPAPMVVELRAALAALKQAGPGAGVARMEARLRRAETAPPGAGWAYLAASGDETAAEIARFERTVGGVS